MSALALAEVARVVPTADPTLLTGLIEGVEFDGEDALAVAELPDDLSLPDLAALLLASREGRILLTANEHLAGLVADPNRVHLLMLG